MYYAPYVRSNNAQIKIQLVLQLFIIVQLLLAGIPENTKHLYNIYATSSIVYMLYKCFFCFLASCHLIPRSCPSPHYASLWPPDLLRTPARQTRRQSCTHYRYHRLRHHQLSPTRLAAACDAEVQLLENKQHCQFISYL